MPAPARLAAPSTGPPACAGSPASPGELASAGSLESAGPSAAAGLETHSSAPPPPATGLARSGAPPPGPATSNTRMPPGLKAARAAAAAWQNAQGPSHSPAVTLAMRWELMVEHGRTRGEVGHGRTGARWSVGAGQGITQPAPGHPVFLLRTRGARRRPPGRARTVAQPGRRQTSAAPPPRLAERRLRWTAGSGAPGHGAAGPEEGRGVGGGVGGWWAVHGRASALRRPAFKSPTAQQPTTTLLLSPGPASFGRYGGCTPTPRRWPGRPAEESRNGTWTAGTTPRAPRRPRRRGRAGREEGGPAGRERRG